MYALISSEHIDNSCTNECFNVAPKILHFGTQGHPTYKVFGLFLWGHLKIITYLYEVFRGIFVFSKSVPLLLFNNSSLLDAPLFLTLILTSA